MLGRIAMRRRASIALPCEPVVAYDVLSDYGTYADWMPGVATSSVLARETNFAIAEIEYHARPAHKFTLECIHAPTQMVLARSLSGHAFKLKMEWKITPAAPGECNVTLTVVGPIFFSAMIGGYAKIMSPAATLRALRAQVSTFATVLPTGEVLIEIAESEEGLVCTYKGKKYKMEPVS
jgi:ribosome-associated toxin RatA of RatAB toxin-antitoxin module